MKQFLIAALLALSGVAWGQQTPQLVQPCTMAAGSNYCQPTAATNALPTMAADAVNFNNTILTNGTVNNGLFSSGPVINPVTNQVLLGPIDTLGALSFSFSMSITAGSGGTVQIQQNDNLSPTTWSPVSAQYSTSTSALVVNGGNVDGLIITGPIKSRYIRIIAFSGATVTININGYLRSSVFTSTITNPLAYSRGAITIPGAPLNSGSFVPLEVSSSGYLGIAPYSIPEATWQYSTAGTPITTATSNQLNASCGTGIRNYIDGIQFYNTGAAGTEIQIVDGSSNILWDGFLGAAASLVPGKIEIGQLGIPVRDTATASAVSVKTISGTTISITGSIQGYCAY